MLVVVMLVGMVPALGITVGATDKSSGTSDSPYILYEEDFNDVTTRVNFVTGENTAGATDGWYYTKHNKSTGNVYIENGRMYVTGDYYDVIHRMGGEAWSNYTVEVDFGYMPDHAGWGGICYNLESAYKTQKGCVYANNSLYDYVALNGSSAMGTWTNNTKGVNSGISVSSTGIMQGKAVRFKIIVQDNRAEYYYAEINDDGSMKTGYIKLAEIDNIPENNRNGSIGFTTSKGSKASFWVDNIKCYPNERTYMLYQENFSSYTEKVVFTKNAVTEGWHYLDKSTNGDNVFIDNGRMYVMGTSYDMVYLEGGENWKNYTFEVDFAYVLDNGGDTSIQLNYNKGNAWGGICYNVKEGVYNGNNGNYFQKLTLWSNSKTDTSTKVNIGLNGGHHKAGGATWINNDSSNSKTNLVVEDYVAIANGAPVRYKIVVEENTAVAYYAMLNDDGTTKGEYKLFFEISNIPDSCLGGSIGFMTGNSNLTSYWVDNIKCYSNEPAFYTEDFNSYEDTVLKPNTINTDIGLWYVQNSANSEAKIENGALYLSGGGSGITNFDAVFFTMGAKWENYILEADYTYLLTETRAYSGLMYRSTDIDNFQKAAVSPFIGAEGMGVLNGQLDGNWYNDATGVTKIEYDASKVELNKPIRLRVETVGNYAKLYVAYYDDAGNLGAWNFVMEINGTFHDIHSEGTIGLMVGCSRENYSASVCIDNIAVSSLPAQESYTTNVYEPESGIVNPPVVVQKLTDTLPSAEGERAAVVMMDVDADMNVLKKDGSVLTTVSEFIDTYRKVLIPAFIVDSEAEADALAELIAEKVLKDCYVMAMANNASLVRRVRMSNDVTKFITGALIFEELNSKEARQNARALVVDNMSFVAISIAPISEDSARYFNIRQIAAWSFANDASGVYKGIANGYHGIISENIATVYDVYESITTPTVSGKPIIVSHRGGNNSAALESRYPENTIEAIIGAKNELKADAVEVDIHWLTKDGHLVLMHDSTLDRTTDVEEKFPDRVNSSGTVNVSALTLAEIKTLTVNSVAGSETKVPTIEELFVAIKDMDIVIYLHCNDMTGVNHAIVSYFADKYDCKDKIVMFNNHKLRTAFNPNNEDVADNAVYGFEGVDVVAGGVPFVLGGDGYILGKVSTINDGLEIMRSTMLPYNYQPFFYPYDRNATAMWITESFYYQLSARGFVNSHSVTNGQANLDYHLLTTTGAVGVLTDNTTFCNDYHYAIEAKSAVVKKGEVISLTNTVKKNVGSVDAVCGYVQLSGGTLTEKDGGLTMNEAGSATVVYYVDRTTDGGTTYRVYSEPVTLTFVDAFGVINGYVLSLKGNIGVQAYVLIDESVASNENVYVKFSVDGVTTVKALADAIYNADYGYGFECEVGAPQMTSEIIIELYVGEELVDTDSYSVAEYAKAILDNEKNLVEYTKAQPVVKAMLNYGAVSQVQFGYNLGNLANSILAEDDRNVSDNAEAIKNAAVANKGINVNGVTYQSTTLGLESETALYHFFAVTDTDISKYTVEGASEAVMIGNALRVKIADIGAANLSTAYEVSVTYNGETITVIANAMAYAKAVVNSNESDTMKTLVNALYEYNVAMVEYNKG